MIEDEHIIQHAERVIAAARETAVRLATAESCTGGLLAGCLTEIAGASTVFDRGFVTYSNAAKTEMLGVPADLIATYGAVSLEAAKAMAQGALEHSAAHIAVSITGIAGPGGGSPLKPVGMVCFGIALAPPLLPSGQAPSTTAEVHRFGSIGRAKVRRRSLETALGLLLQHLTSARHG